MILIYILLMFLGLSGIMRMLFYRPRYFYHMGPREHMMHDDMMHDDMMHGHDGHMWEDGKWM